VSISKQRCNVELLANCSLQSNGIIVIAFGYNGINNETYPTNQVTLYDTTTNRIYNQSVSGSPPEARILASSALGRIN
jgi:hypothetical protein